MLPTINAVPENTFVYLSDALPISNDTLACGITLPLIFTSPPSCKAITDEASSDESSVIVVVVAMVLTSMVSPLSGASVNVSVVPLTPYAVVGSCTTPLILTIQLAVV
jgi:hypothetical protein